jgi:hypothetical protein
MVTPFLEPLTQDALGQCVSAIKLPDVMAFSPHTLDSALAGGLSHHLFLLGSRSDISLASSVGKAFAEAAAVLRGIYACIAVDIKASRNQYVEQILRASGRLPTIVAVSTQPTHAIHRCAACLRGHPATLHALPGSTFPVWRCVCTTSLIQGDSGM